MLTMNEGLYVLMFAANVAPTTIPPYNKGVFAVFLLLFVVMIIRFSAHPDLRQNQISTLVSLECPLKLTSTMLIQPQPHLAGNFIKIDIMSHNNYDS